MQKIQKDNPQNWYLCLLLFVLTSKSRFFSTFSMDWLIVSSKLHETRWYHRMKLIMIYSIELDSNTLSISSNIYTTQIYFLHLSEPQYFHCTTQYWSISWKKVRLACRAQYMYATASIYTYHYSLIIKCFNIVNTSHDIWTKFELWVSPHICSVGF